MDALSLAATISTILFFIASSGTSTLAPLLATFANCILWFKYGILLGDRAICAVNGFGLCTSVYSLIMFYRQTDRVQDVEKSIGRLLLPVYAVLIYVKWFHDAQSLMYLGLLCSTVTVIMFGSPLISLSTIVRTRNASILSPTLVLSSLVVSGLWTAYGLRNGDWNVIVPNALGAFLAVIQLIVMLLFRSPSKYEPLTEEAKRAM